MGSIVGSTNEVDNYDSGLDALCNAVIARAAEDYRSSYERLKDNREKLHELQSKGKLSDAEIVKATKLKTKIMALKADIKQVETFMMSQHFSLFSDLDGVALLEALKREVCA